MCLYFDYDILSSTLKSKAFHHKTLPRRLWSEDIYKTRINVTEILHIMQLHVLQDVPIISLGLHLLKLRVCLKAYSPFIFTRERERERHMNFNQNKTFHGKLIYFQQTSCASQLKR